MSFFSQTAFWIIGTPFVQNDPHFEHNLWLLDLDLQGQLGPDEFGGIFPGRLPSGAMEVEGPGGADDEIWLTNGWWLKQNDDILKQKRVDLKWIHGSKIQRRN